VLTAFSKWKYIASSLLPNLSGLRLEYGVLQVYSKDAGQREAEIGFNIGQGTQDIGSQCNPYFIQYTSVCKSDLRIQDDDGFVGNGFFCITAG